MDHLAFRDLFNFLDKKVDQAEIKAYAEKYAAETTFKKAAFRICVSFIAGAISMCEIKVYDAGTETKDEMWYKLNIAPNPNENAGEFWHKVVERIYDHGEVLVAPYRDHFYVADRFCKEEKPFGQDIFTDITVGNETIPKKRYRAEDVFYFRLEDKELRRLVDEMGNQYGQILAAAISSYRDSNGKKYKLTLANIKAGDPKFAEEYENVIKKQLKDFMENDRAVYPQHQGYDLQDMGKSANAAKDSGDITSIKKDMFESVAHLCKVPISMLMGNITNMDEIVKEFLTFAVDPVTSMMGKEMTKKTGKCSDWQKGNRIKVDTTKIKHVELLEIGDHVDKLIGSGFACIDEVREAADLNPLNNEFGETHFVTKNYETAAEALKKGGEKE